MDMMLMLFGTGKDLGTTQMCARAIVVFPLTMLMMRLSGRRSLGQRSTCDQVVPILLGSIVSRAIVGASPFVSTMLAAMAIAVLHRLITRASLGLPLLDTIMNGRERVIVRHGTADPHQMLKALISERDLMEAARMHGRQGIDNADLVLERSGQISLIRHSLAAGASHRLHDG